MMASSWFKMSSARMDLSINPFAVLEDMNSHEAGGPSSTSHAGEMEERPQGVMLDTKPAATGDEDDSSSTPWQIVTRKKKTTAIRSGVSRARESKSQKALRGGAKNYARSGKHKKAAKHGKLKHADQYGGIHAGKTESPLDSPGAKPNDHKTAKVPKARPAMSSKQDFKFRTSTDQTSLHIITTHPTSTSNQHNKEDRHKMGRKRQSRRNKANSSQTSRPALPNNTTSSSSTSFADSMPNEESGSGLGPSPANLIVGQDHSNNHFDDAAQQVEETSIADPTTANIQPEGISDRLEQTGIVAQQVEETSIANIDSASIQIGGIPDRREEINIAAQSIADDLVDNDAKHDDEASGHDSQDSNLQLEGTSDDSGRNAIGRGMPSGDVVEHDIEDVGESSGATNATIGKNPELPQTAEEWAANLAQQKLMMEEALGIMNEAEIAEMALLEGEVDAAKGALDRGDTLMVLDKLDSIREFAQQKKGEWITSKTSNDRQRGIRGLLEGFETEEERQAVLDHLHKLQNKE